MFRCFVLFQCFHLLLLETDWSVSKFQFLITQLLLMLPIWKHRNNGSGNRDDCKRIGDWMRTRTERIEKCKQKRNDWLWRGKKINLLLLKSIKTKPFKLSFNSGANKRNWFLFLTISRFRTEIERKRENWWKFSVLPMYWTQRQSTQWICFNNYSKFVENVYTKTHTHKK